MLGFAYVAIGGAIGASMRYAISILVGSGQLFPWATLVINIAGSFAIGLLWGLCGTQDWFHNWGRLVLVVGVLGGFTTFSAFSLETMSLVDAGRIGTAGVYVAASVLGCLVAVWAGMKAAT